MKIAMMTNSYKPFVAGVPISVERLTEGLRRMGHEVVVFAPSYEYSRKFKAFKAEMNRKERLHGQMELEEFL